MIQMNEQFTHLLEDEWDYIFSKISCEARDRILSQLKPDNQQDSYTVDEAFNYVMSQGNDGFHRFAKAISDEVHLVVW